VVFSAQPPIFFRLFKHFRAGPSGEKCAIRLKDAIMTRFKKRRTIKSLKREWRRSLRRPVTIILCAIGACFFFASLPFIGIAYLFYTSSANSLRDTTKTSGIIVTTCNGNTSTTCHPLVSFRTQSGEKVQFSSNFSSSLMHQGNTVPVNYHPKDPQDAVISSFTSLWLFPVLLGSIGGFLLLVTIVLFIFALALVFGKRSRTPSASMALSESMIPTAPSASMAPTAPSASKYPYHDPMNYNPYR
jgi:hypothetical protein